METPLRELRERLLRGGVAPRRVRRYLHELADHLADLRTEARHAGAAAQEAEAMALQRLGGVDELAAAILARPEARSWCARAPWAAFTLGPLALLGAAYLAAAAYLWCGWRLFLPTADTPFGARAGAIYSVANCYFQAGKLFYFTAPILVGLAATAVAARQRLKALWPTVALLLIAGMGATTHIRAGRTAVPQGLGHIQLRFFALPPSDPGFAASFAYAGFILALSGLPLLAWNLRHRALRSS